jgi:hypothetical protein
VVAVSDGAGDDRAAVPNVRELSPRQTHHSVVAVGHPKRVEGRFVGEFGFLADPARVRATHCA